MTTTTFVATAGLEAAPLQDGAVLYNLKTSKFIMLNRSAASLWNELSAPKTESELVHHLCATFPDVNDSAAQQGIGQVLKDLSALELVVTNTNGAGTTPASHGARAHGTNGAAAYEQPSVRLLDEEELLKIFQMTAAEISVASCWWGACPTGCP